MRKKEEILKQLRRPPSVVNWASHNYRRLDETRRGLMQFALSPPRHSLGEVYSICEAIVVDRIGPDQARKCIERIKHPATKRAASEVIPAFIGYVNDAGLEGISAFKGFRTPYPIGRAPDGSTMTVQVVPTFTVLGDAGLKPIFMVAWSSRSLTEYQKRLLSTIIKNAILTQQDFLGSDAEVICTPKFKSTESRIVKSWSVRNYATLSENDLAEQFDRYGTALAEVIRSVSGE